MLKFLKSLFVMKDPKQTDLERFLLSKGCTDIYCVDYWTREFERRNHA